MEDELRHNLSRCAQAFMTGRDIGISTLGRLSAGDWRFFDRVTSEGKTFTARKYDEVMQWFSDNWPPETDWPVGIARPQQQVMS